MKQFFRTPLFRRFVHQAGILLLTGTVIFMGCGGNTSANGASTNEASGSPENFAAVLTTTAGEVILTWDAPADKGYFSGAAATDISYKVYSSSSTISDTAELTPVDTGADLRYTFSGTAGESWYFAITANNGGADSPLATIGPFTLANQLQFNANGGTGTVEPKVFNTGETATIPATTGITKTGSALAAWNTAADGSGTYYDLTEDATLAMDLTLYAVWSTDGLAYTLINSDAEYSVTGGSIPDTATYIEVAGYWMGKKVTEVGDNAFKDYTALTDIKLPSTITSIITNAFSGCTNLALTSLPDGITSIINEAFSGCTNLALTSLPDGITYIGYKVFFDCSNLALTSLPDGLTSLGKFAFSNCSKLALTSLPDGITSIGDYVFFNCTNLALTSLPDGITSIGFKAFNNCTNLALTSLPDGITSIGDEAFANDSNLALTSLPDGIRSIGDYAFASCSNLALTSLPDGITSLGNQAFAGTTMTSMTIPASVTSLGTKIFHNNSAITEVTLEGDYDTLTDIFGTATALATVNIPNDTTPATLSGTVFPSSVTSIKVPSSAVSTYESDWSALTGVTISAYSS